MLDLKQMRAIGMMVARQAQEKAKQPDVAANEIIDMAPLLKEWKQGKHEAGEVVVYNGYPYKCVQSHDSTYDASWNPEDAPALFAPYHATDKAHALPYVRPTGAHDAYKRGEWMLWDGKAYECQQDGTIYDPTVLPSAWRQAE